MLEAEISSFIYDYAALNPVTATYWGLHRFDSYWDNLSSLAFEKRLSLCQEALIRLTKFNLTPSYGYLKYQKWLKSKIKFYQDKSYYSELYGYHSYFQRMVQVFDLMNDYDQIKIRLINFPSMIQDYIKFLDLALKYCPPPDLLQMEACLRQASFLSQAFGWNLLTNYPEFENEIQKGRDGFKDLIVFWENNYLPLSQKKIIGIGLEAYKRSIKGIFGSKLDLIQLYYLGFQKTKEKLREIELLLLDRPDLNILKPSDYLRRRSHHVRLGPLRIDLDQFFLEMLSILQEQLPHLENYFLLNPKLLNLTLRPRGINNCGDTYYPPRSCHLKEEIDYGGTIIYGVNLETPQDLKMIKYPGITFHEGIPGHHLHISYVMDNKQLNFFQQITLSSGTVEGWAHYIEEFMNEIGAYQNDEDYLGFLLNKLYRALRIVIDLGIHLDLDIPESNSWLSYHLGGQRRWTPKMAEEALIKIAFLSPTMARDEIVRYYSQPAQALSYTIGKEIILKIREKVIGKESLETLPPDNKWSYNQRLYQFHHQFLKLSHLNLEQILNSFLPNLKNLNQLLFY